MSTKAVLFKLKEVNPRKNTQGWHDNLNHKILPAFIGLYLELDKELRTVYEHMLEIAKDAKIKVINTFKYNFLQLNRVFWCISTCVRCSYVLILPRHCQ